MSGDHSNKGHGFIHLTLISGDASAAGAACRAAYLAGTLPGGVVVESISAMENPTGQPIDDAEQVPPGKKRPKGPRVIVHVHTSDGPVSETAHANIMTTADRLAALNVPGSFSFDRAHEHWCCWSDH
ncbi:MAG: hypothetical protein ACRDF9_11390 [Candidatus Limnocylindria bacterium]